MTDSPYWTAHRHADRRPFLHARATILAAIRAWFADQGFIEADVGAWVESPGAEIHLQAFATAGRFLHASPEFAMKKLLAAGERKIFFLGKAYRAGDRGPLHTPEFTLLEWYRAGAGWREVAEDAIAVARVAAAAIGADEFRYGDERCRLTDPHWLTLRRAWMEAGEPLDGLDPLGTLEPDGTPDRDRLAAAIEARLGPRFAISADDTWSDLFSRIMTGWIETGVLRNAPTLFVLHDYPAPEAALARRSPGDPRIAERFELYACGVELANGFGELTDPVEQRARLEAAMAEKARRYGVRWPIDEDFLAALAHMPPASGCALGVDRLVMLAAGATHIDQVLWNPIA